MTSDAFSKSVPDENPLALLILGLCPAIAASVRVIDALWMSVEVLVVFSLTGLAMGLLSLGIGRRAQGRPACGRLRALLITSLLTASFEGGLLALAPAASVALGIYASLIAVNCLVLGTVIGGVAEPQPLRLVGMSLRRGLGFAASLVLIALVREAFGAGTITLFHVAGFGGTVSVPGLLEHPIRALGLAGGALLALGYFAAAARAIEHRMHSSRSRKEEA
jgi:Na+-translocating ferredoxin:NAD+ oxidoreductase RnfE subunit